MGILESSDKPYITIAIASYNYADYLPRALAAIKRQSFQNFEVLYCDDGSRDQSVEVIKDFIKDNPDMNIRLVINEKNQGLNYTKNRLIQEAHGTYIMLCDADDWMADNCLAKLAETANESNADRVISEVYDIDDNGKIIQIQEFSEKPSKWLWNIHHGCLYKKEVFDNNEIAIKRTPDDVDLITKYNVYAKNVAWVREPLYYWYVHNDSAGRKKNDYQKILKDFQDMSELMNETKTELIKRGCVEEQSIVDFLLIKVYYLFLYHLLRDYSIKKKWECYEILHQEMLKYNETYLENSYIYCPKSTSPARNYARRIICFSAWVEKLHLMKPALLGFHVLSKVINFDQ